MPTIYGTRKRSSPSSAFSQWHNLPPDLLTMITDRLDVTSSIRLSVVCTSWASHHPSLPPFRLDEREPMPWLLVSAHNSHSINNSSNSCIDQSTDLTFYHLPICSTYSIPVTIPFLSSSLSTHRWLGSSKGWLVTVDPQLQLHLIKPLTGTHILLPSVDTIINEYSLKTSPNLILFPWEVNTVKSNTTNTKTEHPKKVLLYHTHTGDTTNKNDDQLDFPVVYCLTEEGSLAVAKVGDDTWTSIHYGMTFKDIIFYRGMVYAISWSALCCYDPNSSYMKRKKEIITEYSGWTMYLLEWKCDLVLMLIDKDERVSLEDHSPNRVHLYKINLSDLGLRMSRITSLGNDALFFAANSSYAVSASGRDDSIQGDCIYFTNQVSFSYPIPNAEGSKQVYTFGAFDLGKKTHTPSCLNGSPLLSPPPIWFWPC